ncbi:flagellar protein essential for flagellar pocket biogenesis [Diplonema papillatum]|nr:flagellar protein essential for flagellar pocket biogenesis [Diplonema papillatum]
MAFVVCVAADIGSKKVNYELHFEGRPSVYDLEVEASRAFQEAIDELPEHASGAFVATRWRLYDEAGGGAWRPLESSQQLTDRCQAYVFQPQWQKEVQAHLPVPARPPSNAAGGKRRPPKRSATPPPAPAFDAETRRGELTAAADVELSAKRKSDAPRPPPGVAAAGGGSADRGLISPSRAAEGDTRQAPRNLMSPQGSSRPPPTPTSPIAALRKWARQTRDTSPDRPRDGHQPQPPPPRPCGAAAAVLAGGNAAPLRQTAGGGVRRTSPERTHSAAQADAVARVLALDPPRGSPASEWSFGQRDALGAGRDGRHVSFAGEGETVARDLPLPDAVLELHALDRQRFALQQQQQQQQQRRRAIVSPSHPRACEQQAGVPGDPSHAGGAFSPRRSPPPPGGGSPHGSDTAYASPPREAAAAVPGRRSSLRRAPEQPPASASASLRGSIRQRHSSLRNAGPGRHGALVEHRGNAERQDALLEKHSDGERQNALLEHHTNVERRKVLLEHHSNAERRNASPERHHIILDHHNTLRNASPRRHSALLEHQSNLRNASPERHSITLNHQRKSSPERPSTLLKQRNNLPKASPERRSIIREHRRKASPERHSITLDQQRKASPESHSTLLSAARNTERQNALREHHNALQLLERQNTQLQGTVQERQDTLLEHHQALPDERHSILEHQRKTSPERQPPDTLLEHHNTMRNASPERHSALLEHQNTARNTERENALREHHNALQLLEHHNTSHITQLERPATLLEHHQADQRHDIDLEHPNTLRNASPERHSALLEHQERENALREHHNALKLLEHHNTSRITLPERPGTLQDQQQPLPNQRHSFVLEHPNTLRNASPERHSTLLEHQNISRNTERQNALREHHIALQLLEHQHTSHITLPERPAAILELEQSLPNQRHSIVLEHPNTLRNASPERHSTLLEHQNISRNTERQSALREHHNALQLLEHQSTSHITLPEHPGAVLELEHRHPLPDQLHSPAPERRKPAKTVSPILALRLGIEQSRVPPPPLADVLVDAARAPALHDGLPWLALADAGEAASCEEKAAVLFDDLAASPQAGAGFRAFQTLFVTLDMPFSDATLRQLHAKADLDNDSELSLQEWTHFLRQHPTICDSLFLRSRLFWEDVKMQSDVRALRAEQERSKAVEEAARADLLVAREQLQIVQDGFERAVSAGNAAEGAAKSNSHALAECRAARDICAEAIETQQADLVSLHDSVGSRARELELVTQSRAHLEHSHSMRAQDTVQLAQEEHVARLELEEATSEWARLERLAEVERIKLATSSEDVHVLTQSIADVRMHILRLEEAIRAGGTKTGDLTNAIRLQDTALRAAVLSTQNRAQAQTDQEVAVIEARHTEQELSLDVQRACSRVAEAEAGFERLRRTHAEFVADARSAEGNEKKLLEQELRLRQQRDILDANEARLRNQHRHAVRVCKVGDPF